MPLGYSRSNIKIEGLDALLKDLNSVRPIFAEPWKRAMEKATKLGKGAVESRAPGSQLRGNVTSRLDARPIPLYGIVTTDAERNGFRYPFALEAGKGKKTKDGAHSVTHYRKGPRQGKPTRRWFSGSLRQVRQEINGLLIAAANEIEARWGR